MADGFKFGVALGGGAARALAHIGILEGLEANGFGIDIVTGTSMGAIIGAMYACDRDIAGLRRRIGAYLESEEFHNSKFDFMKEKDAHPGEGAFFRFSQLARRGIFYTVALTRKSFVAEEDSQRHYDFLIPDRRIEDLSVPFAAAALDLVSGREIVLSQGSLRQAIAATCALPGILMPVTTADGRVLVDGGWIDAVPVGPALALGADFVLAIDVSREVGEFETPGNALDVVFRSDSLTRYALAKLQLERADMVLAPETWRMHWADFTRAEDLIENGRRLIDEKAERLRSLLRRKRLGRWIGRR